MGDDISLDFNEGMCYNITMLSNAERQCRHRARLRGEDIPRLSAGAKKGYKQTPEHIEKRRQSLRKYLFDLRALDQKAKERVRKSMEYTKWRLAVFVRDKWTCRKCGAEDCYFEAHHIKSYTKYPDLRFGVSNGITLCLDCHKVENKKQMKGNKNGRRKLAS